MVLTLLFPRVATDPSTWLVLKFTSSLSQKTGARLNQNDDDSDAETQSEAGGNSTSLYRKSAQYGVSKVKKVAEIVAGFYSMRTLRKSSGTLRCPSKQQILRIFTVTIPYNGSEQ